MYVAGWLSGWITHRPTDFVCFFVWYNDGRPVHFVLAHLSAIRDNIHLVVSWCFPSRLRSLARLSLAWL